jgi:hypothetical protein
LIYNTGDQWQVKNTGFRSTAFTLSGVGTKRIPISRPQVLVWKNKNKTAILLIYRDEERGNKISVAASLNLKKNKWKPFDLTGSDYGSWEPSYDISTWKEKLQVHLFAQRTDQTDAEGLSQLSPQMVSVLEWKLEKK